MNVPGRVSTGVAELDGQLGGGLLPGRCYLVRGDPGSGKSTLALHFLTAGSVSGERSLLIGCVESEANVRQHAEQRGFDLRKVAILDVSPSAEFFTGQRPYNLFVLGQEDRDPVTRIIFESVKSTRPQRVVVEDIAQFRWLASSPLEFRKQVLSLASFLEMQNATLMITDEPESIAGDELHYMVDGIFELSNDADAGRGFTVVKMRGSAFQEGRHSMRLTPDGIEMAARFQADRPLRQYLAQPLSSGVAELDMMLHGGLERGTASIISGPSGVGKTSVAMQFIRQAASSGERSVVYTFVEDRETLMHRSEAIKQPLSRMLRSGSLSIVDVEPAACTPDGFADLVFREVRDHSARVVLLDNFSGYKLCVRSGGAAERLHELARCLKDQGVTLLLVNDTEDVAGDFRPVEQGIGQFADNILFLRYVEIAGELRKAIGVLKKRLTGFEQTLREVRITPNGLLIGPPLMGVRGILGSAPVWDGTVQRAAA